MLSAGKHEPAAKRGKTSNGCQARENINHMLNVGKQVQNKYTLLSAGKHESVSHGCHENG